MLVRLMDGHVDSRPVNAVRRPASSPSPSPSAIPHIGHDVTHSKLCGRRPNPNLRKALELQISTNSKCFLGKNFQGQPGTGTTMKNYTNNNKCSRRGQTIIHDRRLMAINYS